MEILLLRAARLYSPADEGACDLLVTNGRILAMGPDLAAAARALNAREVALPGTTIPGLIDQHMHFLGGGDADGPLARMPELSFESIVAAGITTAVGALGSEIEAKTLPLLLRKAQELNRAGFSAYIYTGAMALPPPFLTTSIRSDIVLIDQVLGAKSAVADRLYPNPDDNVRLRLGAELLQARAMSGKASVLHVHVGRLARGIEDLFDLIERLDFPPAQITPTHLNRSPEVTPLFAQGLRFARAGGSLDFTCCLGPLDHLPAGMDVLEAVRRALDAGIPLERITLSSDAGVAVPDGTGGARAVPAGILWRDLQRLVAEGGLSWPEALALVTTNVARGLGLAARKGRLAPGMDADLVNFDDRGCIRRVFARGRPVYAFPSPLK